MKVKFFKKNLYTFLLSFHLIITIIYLSHRVSNDDDDDDDNDGSNTGVYLYHKVLQLLYSIITYVPYKIADNAFRLDGGFRGILEKVSLWIFLVPVIIQNLYSAGEFV